MTPNVISALGGAQVFGARAAHLDLLEEVERGLPVGAYEAVAEALELTPAEEDRLLQVSLRTRARWKKRTRLDAPTSDRLVRLARILALAVLVLESRENAVGWLREPSPALGGRSPSPPSPAIPERRRCRTCSTRWSMGSMREPDRLPSRQVRLSGSTVQWRGWTVCQRSVDAAGPARRVQLGSDPGRSGVHRELPPPGMGTGDGSGPRRDSGERAS